MSADTQSTQRLTAAIGRRLRSIAASFRRPAKPHPELYGPLPGHVDSADVVKQRLSKPDVDSEHAQAMQAFLPIGPSCC